MSCRSVHLAAVLASCGLGLLAAGCGSGPKLARVSGTVTYKSKPLVGATVVFYPGQEGVRSAMGVTDDQGRYTLWTYGPGDGAVVGKHQVAISLRGPAEKSPINPSMKREGLGEAYYDQVAATGKPLIPEKYFTPQTSGFTADVVTGRQNTFDFPLEGDLPKKP